MRYASFVMALIAFGCGIVAAAFWYRSSKVPIDPRFIPADEFGHLGPAVPELEALKAAARLNSVAAVWTAVSVAAGALASIFGTL